MNFWEHYIKNILHKTSSTVLLKQDHAQWSEQLSYYKVDGHNDVLCMWVCGEGALQVDNLQEHEILKGASLLLRYTSFADF